MVQPGGKIEWWILRSLALKERPAKTGETVIVCPLGKCSTVGAIAGNHIIHVPCSIMHQRVGKNGN